MSVRLPLLSLLLLLACACQPVPSPPLALPGLSALPLAVKGIPQAACWLADSSRVALAAGSLQLWQADSGALQWSRPFAAGVLACSPRDDRLLAGDPGPDRSLLRDCRWPSGRCREDHLPGRLLQVAWTRNGEPLLVSLDDQPFSFGENLSYRLYRWGEDGLQLVRSLHDVTIRKGRFRQLEQQLTAVSSYATTFAGDLLLVPLLHDPPAADSYFELRAFYLPGGQDWSVASLPLQSRLLGIDDRKETVLVEAAGQRVGYDLWGGGELATGEGRPLPAASSPGGHVTVDAAGWHTGGPSRALPPGSRVVFAPDGRRALLYTSRQAALVTLRPADPAGVDKRRVPLATLRDWRAGGLIDATEYQRLLGSR